MDFDGKGPVGKLLNHASVARRMMTREQKAGLARLILRWPEGRETLRLKAASDQVLLELYESYDLACNALVFWSKCSSPGAAEIAAEYRFLVAELEV